MSDVNPSFSEDIWFEILKNLPVKILGKCRCVCKSWHSLTVSPSFMAAHLKHYTQNDTNSLLLFRKTNVRYLFFLDSGRIPLQPYHTSKHFTLKCFSNIVGSIHGLICLSDGRYLGDKSRIIIWNPFLSKTIKLPISMTVNCKSRSLTSVLGFGYNTHHNDYRVVKISFNRHVSDNNDLSPLVEVYSVCDRIWRTIPADYLVNNSIHWVSSSNCFVNGAIHWLTWENGINSLIGERILSFDMVEETFCIIEFPIPIVARKQSDKIGIFEYKSELSVSRSRFKYDCGIYKFGFCEIWVRRNECWSMILDVPVGRLILTGPIEYLGRNGSLFGFGRIWDKMLFICDTRTETFSEFGHRQHRSTKFAAFSESLVLLDQNTDVCTDDALERHIHST